MAMSEKLELSEAEWRERLTNKWECARGNLNLRRKLFNRMVRQKTRLW